MPTPRRLTATLCATALAWTMLALGAVSPPAYADTDSEGSARAPHDPATYYAGTEGLSGIPLASKLNTIISGHTSLTYAELWTALPITDADPSSPSTHLIDFYAGTSILISNRCQASCPAGSWNREHSWAKSHGGFDDDTVPGTDLFHMRPEYNNTNSSRGNLDFDETPAGNPVPWCDLCTRDSDSFEPRDAIKGDLARGLFYMAVRYDGGDGYPDLKMNDRTCNTGSGPSNANHGKLTTLIAWSSADPPDDRERARNDLIDGTYQHNRNPFIDHPEWVTAIWGNGVGQGPACGSTVEPTPSNPTVAPMTASTTRDVPVTKELTATDSYGGPLAWTVTSGPANGTLTIPVGSSTATYTPAPSFTGTDVATVTVTNIKGGSSSTTLTVTVTGDNQAPTTAPMSGSTPEDTLTTVELTGSDPDGDPLTWSVTQEPAHGTASVSGSTLTYTPAPDFSGSDTVGVAVSDGQGGTTSTTVTMTVDPVNDAPVAHDLSVATARDTSKEFTLTGSDVDDTELTYAVASQPAHGSVGVTGATATYTPAPGYTGDDAFTFTVTDPSDATSPPATVTVTVTSTSQAPTATPVSATTAEDDAVTFTLTASDPDDDPLTYEVASPPAHGSVALDGDQATYTPGPDYHGTDSFTWSASDGTFAATSSATVTVTPVNDAPSVSATLLETAVGSPVSATLQTVDADGDQVAISAVSAPAQGSVTYSGTTVTYTPAAGGQDAFLVTVTDGQDGTATAQVGVQVTKLAAKLRVSAGTLRAGQRGVIKVKVRTLAGAAATGKVKLVVGKKKLTAKLNRKGVAKFRIAKLPEASKVKVSARYVGDSRYTAGSVKRTFELEE